MIPELKNLKVVYSRVTNKSALYCTMKNASGRKWFLKIGFKPCLNSLYLENDFFIVQYNNIMKLWIINAK